MFTVQRMKLDKWNKQIGRGSVCVKALILSPHCDKWLTDQELVLYLSQSKWELDQIKIVIKQTGSL